MKKLFFVLVLFLTFFFIGCNNTDEKVDDDKILSKALEDIVLPERCESDLNLLSQIEIDGHLVSFEWSSNGTAIDNSGKVTRQSDDVSITLNVTATVNDVKKEKTFNVVVVGTGVNLESLIESLAIGSTISSDIDLPSSLLFDGTSIQLTWSIEKKSSDNRSSIDNNGHVVLPIEEDALFTLKASVSFNGLTKEKSFDVTLLSYKSLCVEASKQITIPSSINDDINLPKKIGSVDVEWFTSNSSVLSEDGKCSYVSIPKVIKLSAGFSIDYEENDNIETYFFDVDYTVQVLPYSFNKRVSLVSETISFVDNVYGSIILPTTFDYDVIGSWSSSNKDVISDTGVVTSPKEDTTVKLELTLVDVLNENNVSKLLFEVEVKAILDNEDELEFFYHNIIDYTSKYSASHLKNLKFNDDGKVVLDDNSLSGTYESRVFHTNKFKSLVGSWSCITSPNATIELEISIYVGGKWSKYFTYGVWGLGKTNTYYNQNDSATNTKMSVDEIFANDGNATACKYRVTLKRDSLSTASPVLSLVCLTIEINDSTYAYPVDVSSLPKSVDNDLPKLYQYDVPGIGGSICSATTTTMLLKWKGYSFADKGYTYEHEYIASLVADPGHNSPTYGNWSYNMAVAGAYGDNAYVARMYSWEEVMYHLATVGPMGASIKSSNGEWGYKTNGHLVVVRGYRISDSGDVTVICNDPAVKSVYYTVTLNQFLQCWRGVSYVIEK